MIYFSKVFYYGTLAYPQIMFIANMNVSTEDHMESELFEKKKITRWFTRISLL